jgi:hypothetical protein
MHFGMTLRQLRSSILFSVIATSIKFPQINFAKDDGGQLIHRSVGNCDMKLGQNYCSNAGQMTFKELVDHLSLRQVDCSERTLKPNFYVVCLLFLCGLLSSRSEQ